MTRCLASGAHLSAKMTGMFSCPYKVVAGVLKGDRKVSMIVVPVTCVVRVLSFIGCILSLALNVFGTILMRLTLDDGASSSAIRSAMGLG